MNLSVIKDNQDIFQVDLASEVLGNEESSFSLFIGRDKMCKVHLDDKRVSREHALLKYNHGSWSIEKCDDFNQLIINGTAYSQKELVSGDLIVVGPFSITVGLIDSVASTTSVASTSDEFVHTSVSMGLGDEATEFLSETTDDEVSVEPVVESADYSEDPPIIDESSEKIESNLDEGHSEETAQFAIEEEDYSENNDDEFSDDSYDDNESYDLDTVDDGTKVLQSFARFDLELFGEHAPYDKYSIEGVDTFIGRDPDKCQIILNDPEVSGQHAKLIKRAMRCSLEDLRSGNGTLLNGERVNSSDLKNGDEFIIGSTTFRVKVSSDFLEQERSRIMPVEENQFMEIQEIIEVDKNFDGDLETVPEGGVANIDSTPTSNALFSKDALKDPEKRKKLIYILVVLVGAWVFLDDGKKPTPKINTKKTENIEEIASSTKKQRPLTKQEKEIVDAHYILVTQFHSEGKYAEAIMEADKIYAITPSYKNLDQYAALAKEGVKRSEQLEQERREKERERIRKIKVKKLIIKAERAIKDEKMTIAEGVLNEIVSLDPNNDDVLRMRREIKIYKNDQDRLAVEKAQKDAERKRQVQALAPGKTYYLQKQWYKASHKLADFLRSDSIDEDLRKEAAEMLNTSKGELNNIVQPLLGKARSLKEGQDLKGAYEVYLEISEAHPSHEETLNEMNEIRERLENRSKKLYREAIISESLSLYNDAREKFQEVQQVSPTDSEYYKKATEKLKGYLE